jgi:hypothetical protein
MTKGATALSLAVVAGGRSEPQVFRDFHILERANGRLNIQENEVWFIPDSFYTRSTLCVGLLVV